MIPIKERGKAITPDLLRAVAILVLELILKKFTARFFYYPRAKKVYNWLY
jgi:hypothetical protein